MFVVFTRCVVAPVGLWAPSRPGTSALPAHYRPKLAGPKRARYYEYYERYEHYEHHEFPI